MEQPVAENIDPEALGAAIANALLPFVPEGVDLASLLPGPRYSQYADDPVGFGEQVLGETYTDDVKRMMESVRDYPVTIAKSANATGKTHGAGRVAIWFYKCHEQCQVYTAAAPPEGNLKRLLWGEIGDVLNKHPKLLEGETKTALNIQSAPLDFLTGVTIPVSGTREDRVGKFSGKHRPHLLFILDEGDAIPDEVYEAIETCMSGGMVVRLLIMFNPKAEAGEVYRMERDGRANIVQLSAFRHPNVVTGENVIPGAVTRETTVRRINEWCRPLVTEEQPDSECFELPEYLGGAIALNAANKPYPPLKPGWYKVIEAVFSYIVLGQYPAKGANQLISREWVERARQRWDAYVRENGEKPPATARAIMGQDVGEEGTDPSVTCFRYNNYVERLIQWQGVDPIVTGDRATLEYKNRPMLWVNVDATGVGSGVGPHMQRKGCSVNSVKVSRSPTEASELGDFKIMRDQLWWACREWLRTDPGAMLPPDEELTEELCTPTYDIENGKIRVMKKDVMKDLLKRSPNKADALCLTFFSGGYFDNCFFQQDSSPSAMGAGSFFQGCEMN